MKQQLFIYLLILSSFNSESQCDHLGHIIRNDSTLLLSQIDVSLMDKDSLIYKTNVTQAGTFSFKGVKDGIYTLILHSPGYGRIWIDSFNVNILERGFIYLGYPPPCYQVDKPVVCYYNNTIHYDNIIPIIYGATSEKQKKEAEEGNIFLGGISDSSCDPKYYCKLHKIRL